MSTNKVIPPLKTPDLTYTLPYNGPGALSGNLQTLYTSVAVTKTSTRPETPETALAQSGKGPAPEAPPATVPGASQPLLDPNGKTVAPIDPDKYTVSSKWNVTRNLTGKPKRHKGIDLAAKSGTPIHAVKDGVVSKVSSEYHRDASGQPLRNADGSYKLKGYGNYVEVKHADGTYTRYAHLSGYNTNAAFKPGAQIGAGTVIGYVGNTGTSFGKTGNHLHLEVRDTKTGKDLDPTPLIK